MLDSPIDDRQLLELRDVVTQTLTCTGVLGKYKAQLRASVYDVLHGRPRGEVYFENSRLGAIKTNEENNLLAQLIVEYFDFYDLKFTKSVMLPEANIEQTSRTQVTSLLEQHSFDVSRIQTDQPILLQLFSKIMQGAAHTSTESSGTKPGSPSETSPKTDDVVNSSHVSSIPPNENPVQFKNEDSLILSDDSFEEEQLSSTMKKRKKKNKNSPPQVSQENDTLPPLGQKLPPLKPLTPIVEKPKTPSPKQPTFLTGLGNDDSELNISDIQPSPKSDMSIHSHKSNESNTSHKSNGSHHSAHSQKSNHSLLSNKSKHSESKNSPKQDLDNNLEDFGENEEHQIEHEDFGETNFDDLDFEGENWDVNEIVSDDFSGEFNETYSDDFKDNVSSHSLNDFSDHTAHSENFDDVENVLEDSF